MPAFTATTRVPTRPLSYANKDMAYRKELMIDYTNGLIYVVDENGDIIDVTQSVYENLIKNYEIGTGDTIIVKVPNPDGEGEIEITLQQSITEILQEIEVIKQNIEEIRKIIEELSPGSGEISIDAGDIITDATHQFVTQTQLANMAKKVHIDEKIVSINVASISGSVAPYTLTVSVAGLNPSYPSPLLDISYTNDVFSTNEAEEDAFYTIQRCKITTANEATIYFREKPTTNFNVRFVIYTPGI